MKYGIYEIANEKVKMYCLAPLTNKEFDQLKKVAETRTKKEAQKMINDLGWIAAVQQRRKQNEKI